MQISIFKSTRYAKVLGYTRPHDSGKLPHDLGPWTSQGKVYNALPADGVSGVGPAPPIMETIEKEGFFIAIGDGTTAPSELVAKYRT